MSYTIHYTYYVFVYIKICASYPVTESEYFYSKLIKKQQNEMKTKLKNKKQAV